MVHFLCTVHFYDKFFILNASKAINMKNKTIPKQNGPHVHFLALFREILQKNGCWKIPKGSSFYIFRHFEFRIVIFCLILGFFNICPPIIFFNIMRISEVIRSKLRSTEENVEVWKYCAASEFLTLDPK